MKAGSSESAKSASCAHSTTCPSGVTKGSELKKSSPFQGKREKLLQIIKANGVK